MQETSLFVIIRMIILLLIWKSYNFLKLTASETEERENNEKVKPFWILLLLLLLFRMESRNACEWIINTFSGEEYAG